MTALMQEPSAGIKPVAATSRRGGFFLDLLTERKAAAFGLALILIFVVLAIIAPLISPYSPTAQSCGTASPMAMTKRCASSRSAVLRSA